MWLSKTRLDHAAWVVIADNLAAWQQNQAQKRGDELAAARQRRLDAVVRNLIASGYEDVIEKMDLDLLRQHKLIKKTGDLTARVWANIKPSLMDFMIQVESKLREEHRLDQITRRRRLFAKYISDLCPPRCSTSVPISELSQAFPIKSVIESSPVEQDITFNDFPPPHAIIMLSSLWHRQKRQDLVQIMRKSPLMPRAVSVAHLDLATTFFYCDGPGYREPIGQKDVLIHPSAFSRRPDRDYNSVSVARLFDDLQQEFWNFGGDRISFHESAHLAARSIIAAGGYDPNTTTAATMDGLSFLFECRSCRCSTDGRLVMSWRRAIMHAIDHISISRQLPPPKWIKLDLSDPFYATAVAQIVGEEPFFRCHICNMFGDAALITNHIRERHTLYQTVTVMRQPHSPVRVPCPLPLLGSGNSLDDSIAF
ncbi:hypothetical protein E4T56_gene9730 [Termitomyces sp. T112]|nr:hypothetical protein E4T56_gene9730 [Termitomyces sp. T112]